MLIDLPVSRLRQALAEVLNRVAYGDHTIRVVRHGRVLGYFVSPSDFEEYQLLLDAQDRAELDAARAAGELDQATPFRASDFDATFAAEPIYRYRVKGDKD